MSNKKSLSRSEGISSIVAFFDIVGFTRNRSFMRQEKLILSFTDYVQREIEEPYISLGSDNHNYRGPNIILSPSGDGLAIAFNHFLVDPNLVIEIIEKILYWGVNEGVRLRCGIHTAPLICYVGLGGITNFCGEAINYAKRVMDIGDDHVICSVSAFNRIGKEIFDKHNWKYDKAKMYYVKHRERVHIRNITKVIKMGKDKYTFGCRVNPSKYMSAKFEYRHKGFKKKQSDILKAKKLTCVAITSIGLMRVLRDYCTGSKEHKKQMAGKDIEIFRPTKQYLHPKLERKSTEQLNEEYEDAKKIYRELKNLSKGMGFNINLEHYDFFPTFGALGFDYDSGESNIEESTYDERRKIRVVWYIWGEDANESPYADFIHPGDDYIGGSEYSIFKKAIDNLKDRIEQSKRDTKLPKK